MQKPESAAVRKTRQCSVLTLFSDVHNRTARFRLLRYLGWMTTSLVSAEEAHATRWREWQVKNEAGQQRGARRAHLVFTLIFSAAGIWFALQLVW